MKHRTNSALYSYWNSVRAERLAPQRFEIDPSRISTLLPYTFILELIDVKTLRFRLAGTRMCEMFGTELRGQNFIDGWSTKDRLILLRQISALASQGAVVNLAVELSTPLGQKVDCEVLLLPLLHTGRTINRVLGAAAPLSSPAWAAEGPITTKTLVRTELLWPTRKAYAALAPVPESHDAREADVIRERPARIVRSDRRQFRVVDGGLSTPSRDET